MSDELRRLTENQIQRQEARTAAHDALALSVADAIHQQRRQHMQPQTEAKKPTEKPEVVTVHTRIVSAHFVETAYFDGTETASAAIGRNCSLIAPARIEADGSAIAIDKGQRADGLLLRGNAKTSAQGKRYQAQAFVPWANVKSVAYGE